MPTSPTARKVEVDLSCGDTIALTYSPPIGAYRHCIHCDCKRLVTAVRKPGLAGDEKALARLREMLTGQPDKAVTADISLAYAYDAGLFRSTLEHVLSQLAIVKGSAEQAELQEVIDSVEWCSDVITNALADAKASAQDDEATGISPNFDDDPR